MLTRLNAKIPNNPMIICRLGRYCLEIGRKAEALGHFQAIQDTIQRLNTAAGQGRGPSEKPEVDATELIDNLLDTPQERRKSTTSGSKDCQDLIIANLMNQGCLKIFEEKYEDAILIFREVQTFRPANIVAANNLATCKIFLNKVGEAIKLLEDLVKKDPIKNINE